MFLNFWQVISIKEEVFSKDDLELLASVQRPKQPEQGNPCGIK